MSRIKVKNFGPIKEGCLENDGWIDIEKVTVFIGNQGSGKSTIAKLISTLVWMEKALVRGELKTEDLDHFVKFQDHIAYHNIGTYIKPNSEISYEGEAYSIFITASNLILIHKIEGKKYSLPKIMYIPDGRAFVFLENNSIFEKKTRDYFYDFLEEFENAKNELKKPLDLPIGEIRLDTLPNKLLYLTDKSKKRNYLLNLANASSGFQSYVPLYLVSQYLANSIGKKYNKDVTALTRAEEIRISNKDLSSENRKSELKSLSSRFRPSCFINIVEEPEQNLFPTSQKNILFSLLEFNNYTEANKLIITTHSPYIINYLSTAIQAAYLKNKIDVSDVHHDEDIKKLNAIVPLKSVVDAKDVVIYQMDEKNGTIKRLPSYEGIPSDKNYLNELLADGNHIFDALLELEETI